MVGEAFRVPNPSLPLPVGEVAERSDDGEGNKAPRTLSVTFGDSSPKGGAKGQKTEGRRISNVSKKRTQRATIKVAPTGTTERNVTQKAPLSKGAVSEADRGIQQRTEQPAGAN